MHDEGEKDGSMESCDLADVYLRIPGMVKASLMKVLRETRCGLTVVHEVVEDIGSQVVVDVLSGDVTTMRELRTRIRTLCFMEVDYLKKNQTGQDHMYDDGNIDQFEGPKEGVDDFRKVEDVCDLEGMGVDGSAVLTCQYKEEDARNERIRGQYEYFLMECYAIYKSLESDFLKRFFVEWLINDRDPREIARMIRVKGDEREGITSRRISQLRGIIIDHICDLTELSLAQAVRLIECLPVVIRALADGAENEEGHSKVFFDLGSKGTGFREFKDVDIDAISSLNSEPMYIPEFLPELITSEYAKNRRTEAILRLSSGLNDFCDHPERYSLCKPRRLYPHQYEKLRKVADYLMGNIDSDDRLFFADIAPPGAGKTYIQAVLAKLTGLPFVFVTPSNAVIDGSDGALATFSELFPRGDLGVIDKSRKEFGRVGTLTTYSSFTSASTLREIMSQGKESIPFLFLLDEGDLAQSELRQSVIDAISEALHCPLVCAYSATTTTSGRYLGDIADVVDEMDIYELIRTGKAKHVLGFYVDVEVTIDADNLISGKGEKRVDFSSLCDVEQEAFISSPLQIVLENHVGERGIIHCMSVQHAEKMAERLRDNGVNAECVSARTTSEQMMLREQYIAGDVDVLCSCEYLGRGFSEHGVTDFIIFARLSSSVTSLYQKVGRGFRSREDNPVLVLYQIISSNITARNFKPALLRQIFPMQFNRPCEGHLTVNDMRRRLIEMIRRGEMEFVGTLGESVTDLPGLKVLTEGELSKVIDTLNVVEDGYLELTDDNIAVLIYPIVEAFVEASSTPEEKGLDCIHTDKSFMSQEVVVNGGRIKGARFVFTVLRLLCDLRIPEANKYVSFGIGLIKDWYSNRRRPSVDFIVSGKEKEDERRLSVLRITEENVEELFRPAMDQLIVTAGVENSQDLSWFGWRFVRTLPDIVIERRSISANAFFIGASAILLGVLTKDAAKYKGLSASLMRQWYTSGVRPSDSFVQESLRQESEKRAAALDVTDGNIDELFPLFMEELRVLVNGENGSTAWIKSGPVLDSNIVELEDGSMRAAAFACKVSSILTGLSVTEVQGKWALNVCILREWFGTGQRPSREWCLAQDARLEAESNQKLKITSANIDELFILVMDAFIKVSGEEGCDWCNYLGMSRYVVEVGGKTISGGTFVNQVFKVLTGIGVKEGCRFRGFSAELMQTWYKTGKRPDKDYIEKRLAELRERKDSKLEITEANVDGHFLTLMRQFCRLAGSDDGGTDWISSKRMATLEAVVESEYIKGDDFMFSVCSILLGVRKSEARNMIAISVAIVAQWYSSGERPSKEWCEAKKIELEEEKSSVLNLTPGNIDKLFRPIMDSFICVAGEEEGNCDWFVSTRFARVEAIIPEGKIMASTFVVRVAEILFGLSIAESVSYTGFLTSCIREWYKTGKKPKKEAIEAAKAEREALDFSLTADNIDEYFPLIMEVLREELGGEKRSESWITWVRISKLDIPIGDARISGLTFFNSVASVLLERPKGDVANFSAFMVELVRKWYRDGQRPSKEWCLEQFELAKRKRESSLKITSKNVDQYLVPVVDSLIAEAGVVEGNVDWMSTFTLLNLEANVEGKKIKGLTFVAQVGRAITGLTDEVIRSMPGLIISALKDWYLTGERPDTEYVKSLAEEILRSR